MTRRAAGFAVVVALCGVGCGAAGPRDLGSRQSALTEASRASYAPVGWLVATESFATVPEIGDCSATLIGARTILAAGHCQQRRSRYTFYLFDADGKTKGYSAEDLRTPEGYELITLPDGRGQTTKNDLALLTLRKTPPLSIPRASLTARTPQQLAAELGSSPLDAYAVGLGPEQAGRPQRPPHRTPVQLPEGDDTAVRHGAEELWMPAAADGFGHFVQGDSGGPTIVHLGAPASAETAAVDAEETAAADAEETAAVDAEETAAADAEEPTTADAEEGTAAAAEEGTAAAAEEGTAAPAEELAPAPAEERAAAPEPDRWVVVGVHAQYRVRDQINVDMPISEWLGWIRERAGGDVCEEGSGPVGVLCSGAAPPATAAVVPEGQGDKADAAEPGTAAGCAVGGSAAPPWPAGLLLLLLAAIRASAIRMRCAAAGRPRAAKDR